MDQVVKAQIDLADLADLPGSEDGKGISNPLVRSLFLLSFQDLRATASTKNHDGIETRTFLQT